MFKKLIEIRNNVLISKRLKALVVITSFLIVILSVVSIRSIFTINNKIAEINEVYLKNMVKLSNLIENIYSILIESHIIDEKSLNDNAIDNALNIDLLDTYLAEYEYSLVDEAQKAQYDNFVLEFKRYVSILKEVNSYELQGNYEKAKEVKSGRELDSFKKLQSIIKSMMERNTEGLQTGNQLVAKLKSKVLNRIYFISGLLLLLSILIYAFLLRDIGLSLKKLAGNLSVLKRGEIPEKELKESENEIGAMSELVNSLTGNLASLSKFANDISKGNYSTEYKPASENDLLGKALVNLRNNLSVTKEDDERRKIEDERRNWTNKGHALFGEILRQRSQGITQLTDDIIKNLVYYLKANQGGLFLINDSGDISKIELVSAFAYDRKKFFERSINIGDGLIGTVALERNTIYLKEIPKDYIEIESGLGDATPKSLLIVPLKFEDDILGIVELASFREFEKFEIRFVEELAQSIASTLLTAKINARTEQLLNDSQKQSEELAAREIEVRQNMEEMRATQELAQRREAALSGILSAVDNTLMKGEYELDGTLISVNNRHLQTMGYQLKEIKGKNIEMFIPKEELEYFRKVWASVISGTPRQLEVKRRTKTGEELWLINQYTPVTDVSGKISRVLYLAHDVTKYKKSEDESSTRFKELQAKEEELDAKVKQLDKAEKEINLKDNELNGILNAIGSEQVIIEFDLQGKILKVNKRFEELSGTSFAKLKGNSLDKLFKLNKTKEEFMQ
jgi:PAS domain S-box-containing protein